MAGFPGTYSVRFWQDAGWKKEFEVRDQAGNLIDLSLYTAVQLCQFRTAPVNQGGSVVLTAALVITGLGLFTAEITRANALLVSNQGVGGVGYIQGTWDANFAKANGESLTPVAGPWRMDFSSSKP